MKVLLINIGTKKFGTELRAGLDERGVEYDAVRLRNLLFDVRDGAVAVYHKGRVLDIASYDYAFVRVRGKYAHTSALMMRVLEHYGVPYNDKANREHTDTMEKTVQAVRLGLAGVAHPQTYIFNADAYDEHAEMLAEHVAYPCVLKIDGSKGAAVWQVQSAEELTERIRGLAEGQLVLLQEYIQNEYDIRALYWYGELIGAIKRISTDGFYNNVSKGGSVEVYEMTDADKQIAERAVEALSADFGGVDIMHGPDGPVIVEVNTGPQVYGFEGAHNVSLGNIVAKYIAQT